MRIPFAVLPLLATLTPFTLADVKFVSPAAGGTLPFGSLAVQWTDSGNPPSIKQFDTYTLELVLGADEAGADTVVFPIEADGDYADGNSVTGSIDATVAGSTKNGFYFRMTSVGDKGSVINYSDRFTVTGLTGTTPPNALKAVPGGTAGPPTVNQWSNAAAGAQDPAAGVVPEAGAYTVPFDKQDGTIRYAPMQPFPPTKITKKGKPTPQYPKSAFNIATARMPPPTVVTTITESQTFHAMTMENTVAPQSHPKDDMAKFLARWKD